MAKQKRRNLKKKDSDRLEKIKTKAKKIRLDKNVVVWTDIYVDDLMSKYKIDNYRFNGIDSIHMKTKLSEWRIEHDDVVVKLFHSSEKVISFQNDRGSYHLQNVFYDLDFCLKSIVDHEEYTNKNRYGIRGENNV